MKTRSMTKKELSEETVTTKIVVERVAKQTKKKGKKSTLRPVTADDEAKPTIMLEEYFSRKLRPATAEDFARDLFMLEDYSIRHPPPLRDESEPLEVDDRKCVKWDYAGRLEWRALSAADKAPYFAKLKKKSVIMLPP